MKAVQTTPGRARAEGSTRRKGWEALARVGLIGSVLALGACASPPPAPPVPAPRVEGLPELMRQADVAAAAGDKDKARESYRAAAKAEPTSKEPWLKLAQSYFESGDYGNAILAAQEVRQRDRADTPDSVAAGILTVSGLRVSTSGLAVLRQQNNLNGGTRGEAESMAKALRELLGEPVLFPPVAELPAKPKPKVVRRKPAAQATPPATAAAAATVPAAAVSPVSTAPAAASPFDKLK